MTLIPTDELDQLRLIAMGRAAVGAAFIVLPGAALKGWTGPASGATRVIGRAFGARDLVMGLATLKAIDSGDKAQARFWAQAGAACDGVDVVATWMGARHIPKRSLLTLTVVAAGATAAGVRIARALG